MLKTKKRRLSNTQLIALSFLGVILLGAILLCLPIASRSGEWTSFLDACFTATSATCVTGLIVFDTFTHWSLFGQIVIITMIQIGGLGLMTIMASLALFMKRHINLQERRLLLQSSGNLQYGDLSRMLKRILLGTLLFEGIGAILLAIRFCPRMGMGEGIYNAIFHSVSAFCNAGFDLMGKYQPFSSLTAYVDDPLVSLTICALIIIGGIGFLVWDDMRRNGIHLKRYSLHSKIVLFTTVILVVGGWVAFFFFEQNHALAGMPFGEQVLASFFQSVTPRTAGFNTIDQTALSNPGSILTVILMLVGGSPGSTAGGIKTMTIAIALLAVISIAKNRKDTTVFRRRIDEQQVKQALAILAIYTLLFLVATTAICAWEPAKSLKSVVFEVASAVATVGLSLDGSGSFQPASQVVLILLMYIGRLGGLSLVLMLAEKREAVPLERPEEKILIG